MAGNRQKLKRLLNIDFQQTKWVSDTKCVGKNELEYLFTNVFKKVSWFC